MDERAPVDKWRIIRSGKYWLTWRPARESFLAAQECDTWDEAIAYVRDQQLNKEQ